MDHKDNGESMCPHLPILARLRIFADCMQFKKPPDVDGCSCRLTGAISKPSRHFACTGVHCHRLSRGRIRSPQAPFGSFGGNDSAQTESATPETVRSRQACRSKCGGSLVWARRRDWVTRHQSTHASHQSLTDCACSPDSSLHSHLVSGLPFLLSVLCILLFKSFVID